jgi:hypothetical protein
MQATRLAMLAGTGPRGATESIMPVHFDVELLAGLVPPRMGEHANRNGAR